MSARVSSPVFVGRAPELATLEAALAGAAEGEPRLVLVGGESGVGKSRLLAELRDRAAAGGARVLAGDCLDLGEAELPYAPIVAALRGLEGSEVRTALGPAAEGLAPLLSQLDGPAELPAGGPMAQGRLFELLLALLGALAERAPLVLIRDHLHWADRPTRDLLAFLQRTARRRRLLVVGTYRTDELHRRHPLRPFLAEAERAPRVTRITLERFTRQELVEQLASILDAPPDPRLVEDLYTRGEGNAFFTEELL